jgi:hypothetical protein
MVFALILAVLVSEAPASGKRAPEDLRAENALSRKYFITAPTAGNFSGEARRAVLGSVDFLVFNAGILFLSKEPVSKSFLREKNVGLVDAGQSLSSAVNAPAGVFSSPTVTSFMVWLSSMPIAVRK